MASNFQSVTEMKTSIDVAMDAIECYMLPLMEDFRQYGCKCITNVQVLGHVLQCDRNHVHRTFDQKGRVSGNCTCHQCQLCCL